MGTVISNLKARFGVDTTDFKKGLKDGEKAVSDFKGQAGSMIDEFASMFGINMSAVSHAVTTAGNSLSFVGNSFKGAAAGGNIFKISLNSVKIALISTGIGAIVVALGSLIAYFTKSAEGAGKFAHILAQVKAVFNDVIDRIMKLGKGLFDIMSGNFKKGWEEMTTAFKGIGQEIKDDWKEAGKLADAEEELKKKEIGLITSLSERKSKVAELRLQAKEETEDHRKAYAALNQAYNLTKGVYGDQIRLEKERLRQMKDKLAIASSDPTLDQLKEIAEQEAKVNDLVREQDQELKGIVRERNSVLKAIEAEGKEQKKLSISGALPDLSKTGLKSPSAQYLYDVAQAAKSAKGAMEEFGAVSVDVGKAVENAFADMAVGLGEWLGNMAAGKGSFDDLKNMALSSFGDMAIAIGKTAIAAGVGALGIKKSLTTLEGLEAIGAGIALVALGTAIKGRLSNIAGGPTSGSFGGGTFDNRTNINTINPYPTPRLHVPLQGIGKVEFKISGSNLVGVLEMEKTRRSWAT